MAMTKHKKPAAKKVSFLQQRLKEKMTAIRISAHALEKQAGLKPSAVQNILHGRSKKPSAEILFAVAKILGCPVDELIDNNDEVDLSANNRIPSSTRFDQEE